MIIVIDERIRKTSSTANIEFAKLDGFEKLELIPCGGGIAGPSRRAASIAGVSWLDEVIMTE